MLCELCGKETSFLKPFMIEGSLLKVCQECAKFGKASAPEPDGAGTNQPNSKSQQKGDFGFMPHTKTKEEIIRQRLEHRTRRMTSKDIYDSGGEKELVEDYHKRIQQARNRLNLNQEQLGQKINERKSVISKLESRSMKPDDKLIRKLEKALNIKLMEIIE